MTNGTKILITNRQGVSKTNGQDDAGLLYDFKNLSHLCSMVKNEPYHK